MDAFQTDLQAVLDRARDCGVERILVPGIDLDTSRLAVAMAQSHEGVFAAVGFHPHYATQAEDSALQEIEELAHSPKVRAIGEIGLDFHRNLAPSEAQTSALDRQLDIAARLKLPVVLHSRQAMTSLLPRLLSWAQGLQGPLEGRCGVLHAFSGDLPAAAQATQAGFFLGAAGPVTFPTAEALRSVLTRVSIERLLTETDAPYLAPQKHRGKRNEPSYVRYVAEAVVEIREEPAGSIVEALRLNAVRLFDWDHGDNHSGVC